MKCIDIIRRMSNFTQKKEETLSIGEAARFLGVTVQTLRRWAQSGKLRPSYITPGKHRLYARTDLQQFIRDLPVLALEWVTALADGVPTFDQYCQTSSIFQARLSTFESALQKIPDLSANSRFSLVAAITAEIGENAFAHNLGNWPDVPGVFFAYDTNRRHVVIADRGVGVLATLRRVKPELRTDRDALKVAFTERISGRTPENRGNGLKFVRQVIAQNNFQLTFQSGNAVLTLKGGSPALHVASAKPPVRGTLALLNF